MRAKITLLAAALVLGLSGCTMYESYVVTETKTVPERPVEVARPGGIGDFDKVLVAGADLAAAIIAPVAAVAKAVVISAVDVEVNRSRETRTMKFSRWFTNDSSGFPKASASSDNTFGKAALGVKDEAILPVEATQAAAPETPAAEVAAEEPPGAQALTTETATAQENTQ